MSLLKVRGDEGFAAILQSKMLEVNAMLGLAAQRGMVIELDIQDHTGVADRSKCYHIDLKVKK